MFHARLGSLRLFKLDVELLELGLGAAKLRHDLVVVHLLDLVILELLLVQLRLVPVLLNAFHTNLGAVLLSD